MKKLFTFLMLFGLLAACSEDEPLENKAPVCKITSPASGDILDMYADLKIAGTGSDEDGTIARVTLTVGGQAVEEVTTVPFEYTIPADRLSEGELSIVLTVEDNQGESAKDEVTVKIQDNSQAPTCSITAPADGAVVDPAQPLLISGEGAAQSGKIEKVILAVGGKTITDVTAVPFQYTVKPEELSAGELKIVLTVETDRGKSAKDEVTVRVNAAPTCQITAPADGAELEADGEIVVSGTGADSDGTIASVTLTVNDTPVAEVTSVPFEYTLPKDLIVAGQMKIVLTVEDNDGATAVQEITVNILGRDRTFTDPRDGKVYKTVKLGTQEWFAENLAYLPEVCPGNIGNRDEGYAEKPLYYVYGYFGNDVAEAKALETYNTNGVLYNWYAAVGGTTGSDPGAVPSGVQGPCPDGWHVPSRGEWIVLNDWAYSQIPDEDGVYYTDYGGSPTGSWDERLCKNVNGALKAKDVWKVDYQENELPQLALGGLDLFGFAGIPSGARLHTGDYFYYLTGNEQLNFWTTDWSTYYPANPGGGTISFTSMYYDLRFPLGGSDAQRGHSIRCVKD